MAEEEVDEVSDVNEPVESEDGDNRVAEVERKVEELRSDVQRVSGDLKNVVSELKKSIVDIRSAVSEIENPFNLLRRVASLNGMYVSYFNIHKYISSLIHE